MRMHALATEEIPGLRGMVSGKHGKWLFAMFYRLRTPDLVAWWRQVVRPKLSMLSLAALRDLFIQSFTAPLGRSTTLTHELVGEHNSSIDISHTQIIDAVLQAEWSCVLFRSLMHSCDVRSSSRA